MKKHTIIVADVSPIYRLGVKGFLHFASKHAVVHRPDRRARKWRESGSSAQKKYIYSKTDFRKTPRIYTNFPDEGKYTVSEVSGQPKTFIATSVRWQVPPHTKLIKMQYLKRKINRKHAFWPSLPACLSCLLACLLAGLLACLLALLCFACFACFACLRC